VLYSILNWSDDFQKYYIVSFSTNLMFRDPCFFFGICKNSNWDSKFRNKRMQFRISRSINDFLFLEKKNPECQNHLQNNNANTKNTKKFVIQQTSQFMGFHRVDT